HAARQRALPVDAGGRGGAAAHRDRPDHRRAGPRSRARRRGRTPPSRALPAGQGPRGVLLVRVCVVGCGAVGSLFAANLARLEELEVWAYDLDRGHVDAINRDGLRLSGADDVLGPVRATTDAGELPP